MTQEEIINVISNFPIRDSDGYEQGKHYFQPPLSSMKEKAIEFIKLIKEDYYEYIDNDEDVYYNCDNIVIVFERYDNEIEVSIGNGSYNYIGTIDGFSFAKRSDNIDNLASLTNNWLNLI